jgi:uridine kinase
MSEIIEDLYQGKDFIFDKFTKGNNIISIAGGSCSGKTILVDLLKEELNEDLVILPIDSYYKDGKKNTNFDHPDALELDLVYVHLNDLMKGNSIQKPIYNFNTHSRNGFEIVYPGKYILLEGLFAFFSQFRDISSYNVFTDVNMYIALERRIKRDVDKRGREEKDVIKQFFDTVLPMYLKHVQYQKFEADLIIVNNKQLF